MNTSGIVSEALAIQKIISEELSAKSTMPEKIHIILKSLVDSLKADGALLYATVDENYLELMGRYNVDEYKNNIRYEEGIIGSSASSKIVRFSADTAKNISKICIPITRLHITIGVIVLLKHNADGYDDAKIDETETLCLPLVDLVSSRIFEDYKNQAMASAKPCCIIVSASWLIYLPITWSLNSQNLPKASAKWWNILIKK